MDKMKKVPDIRFKGYEGEWNETPLCEYLCVSNEKNASCVYNKYDIYSVSREYGVINQIEYQGKSFAGASLTGYGIVHTWDVVYTKSPLKQQPYGIIKTNKTKNGIVSALYGIFTPNEKVDSNFVQTYFELDQRLNNYLRPLVNKGAKNTLLISDEDAIKGNVVFPQKEEQEKIVKMFNSLDYLIRKLEQKLEKLRNIKQSLLNQMFININMGGYVPLIRYKNQTYHWNEMSAEEIFHTYYDKNHPDLPVVSASQEYGMVFRDDVGFDVQHDKANEVGYKRVLPGQFVIHLRSFQGGFAYSEVEGITSPAYTIIEFKDKSQNDGLYWKYVLSSKEFIKRLETVTYGIRDGRSISFEDFAELKYMVPQKEEQKQIGKLLLFADCNSRKVENKITKLRTMKQSLLKKMFV